MVDVDLGQRWDVATHPALGAGVELVAGEPRALHLHLVRGTDPGDVAGRWRDVLGSAAVVATRDEAVGHGLVRRGGRARARRSSATSSSP